MALRGNFSGPVCSTDMVKVSKDARKSIKGSKDLDLSLVSNENFSEILKFGLAVGP